MKKSKGARAFLKILFLSFLLSGGALPLFGQTTTVNTKDPWVLGATEFSYREGSKNAAYNLKSLQAAAEVLPKLILAQISLEMSRTVMRDEQIAQRLDTLLTERLAHFLDLSREVQARDTLVLNDYTAVQYHSAVRAQEKKIAAIQKLIDKNLEEQNTLLYPELSDRRSARRMRKLWSPLSQPIELYKNDFDTLFMPSETAKKTGVESHIFSSEVSREKISGLITGTIVVYGNYASVSADLTLFPSGRKIGSAIEVGSLSDLRQMAQNIAFALLPQISNGMPIELDFRISPPAAAAKATVTVDNIIYKTIPDALTITSGFHSVSVEADGYMSETFVYDFSGDSKFLVEVNFKENEDGAVKLMLSRFVEGNLFFAGEFVGESVPNEFVKVPIRVNGKNVFGYFEGTIVDKKGEESTVTMFMSIPGKLMEDGNEIEAKVKVFDVTKTIDRRRRMFYISYSALVLSIPFLFYSYSQLTIYQRGYAFGYDTVTIDDILLYRNLSFAAIGVVAACGIWTIAELVAYLVAVDKTLPVRAKKMKRPRQNAPVIQQTAPRQNTRQNNTNNNARQNQNNNGQNARPNNNAAQNARPNQNNAR